MTKDAAWRVIQTAFQCGEDLQALLLRLKADLNADDYNTFLSGVATAVDTINVQLIDRALKIYPELRARIDGELRQHGRIGRASDS
jgi:hypothetical protein